MMMEQSVKTSTVFTLYFHLKGPGRPKTLPVTGVWVLLCLEQFLATVHRVHLGVGGGGRLHKSASSTLPLKIYILRKYKFSYKWCIRHVFFLSPFRQNRRMGQIQQQKTHNKAKEDSDSCDRQCFGPARPFEMKVKCKYSIGFHWLFHHHESLRTLALHRRFGRLIPYPNFQDCLTPQSH